jgi:hypothetical protein
MLLSLLACAVELDVSEPGIEEGGVAGTAETFVVGVSVDAEGPKVAELNSEGVVVWELAIKDILGSEWEGVEPKPLLMDVQPVAGGTLLLSLHGLGLVETDRSGTIVWRHDDPEASHDVDRLPNGNTLYARTWVEQGEDVVVEIDREGKRVWAWSGVVQYGTNPLFTGYADEGGAWIHPTAVQRLENGNTSVCMRNFNTVVQLTPAGEIAREVTFRAPEGREGPATEGHLQGMRPHGAEWLPGQGLAVGLRSPERAVLIKSGAVVLEVRGEELAGITDVDVLPDGGMLIASHHIVERVNAAGTPVWAWDLGSTQSPTSDGRLHHVFNNITRINADGAPLDLD